MKKRILSLLLMIQVVVCVLAQANKTQITTDLRNTMQDFMADINYIMEDLDNISTNVENTSGTFGSSTYFMYNGMKMESLGQWIQDYCTRQLGNRQVMHSLQIQQNTVTKLKPGDVQDRRYTFQAVLKREKPEGRMPDIMTTWVVVWNGQNEYMTIVEYNDNVNIPVPVILGEVVSGREEFSITLTKVRKQGTQVFIDMMLENTGGEDVIIDQSVYESGQVAYDDKGNKYDNIRISIGDGGWMGSGLGAGNSRRKLLAGVPLKARVVINGIKPDAQFIRRMNWHFACKEWDMTVEQPAVFKDIVYLNKPIRETVKPLPTESYIGQVVTGQPDFLINVTKVSRQGTRVVVEMLVENIGMEDVILDHSVYGAGFAVYDELGNQYRKTQYSMGNDSSMGKGLGAGNSRRKLIAEVPMKMKIYIENVNPGAKCIRRLDWHFECKGWNRRVEQPVKFMNLDIE